MNKTIRNWYRNRILVLFLALILPVELLAQDFPSVTSLLKAKYSNWSNSNWDKNKPQTWRDAEDIILTCVNLLLATMALVFSSAAPPSP